MTDRNMTDDQLREIAEANVNQAIEMKSEYTDPEWLEGDAYSQNAMDTVRELGGTVNDIGEVSDWFWYIAAGRVDCAYDSP